MSQYDRQTLYCAHALAAIIAKYGPSAPWQATEEVLLEHARLANRYAAMMVVQDEDNR